MPEFSPATGRVLDHIASHASNTRASLAQELDYSMPTIIGALAELTAAGLVVQNGTKPSNHGRASNLYELAPGAGWVVAADLGVTEVRVEAVRLNGQLIAAESTDFERGSSAGSLVDAARAAAGIIERMTAELSGVHGELGAVGLAVPRLVANDPDLSTPLGSGLLVRDVIEALGTDPSIPVLLENNVNCSAVAEYVARSAEGVTDLAYVQVGAGLGCGLVIDRRLRRGHRGFSGEISRIPGIATSLDGEPATWQRLESELRGDALLARARASWESAEVRMPETITDLFEIARFHAPAEAMIHAHAEAIARLLLTIGFVVDPDVIVLGGGLGENPVIAAETRAVMRDALGSISVESPLLVGRATVAGAGILAIDRVLATLVGEPHQSPISNTMRPVRR